MDIINNTNSPSGDRGKIIYLINPISGTSKKDTVKKLIERESKAQDIEFEILPTNAKGNYDVLKEKVEKENITDVVMVGGDGTVNQVTQSLKNVKVNFGIIPFGSGNGLAFAAGIPKNRKQL